MKKYILFSLVVAFSFLISCTRTEIGPQGPPGPQGPAGIDGADGFIGTVFEYTEVTFTSPNYEVFLEYPVDFEVFPTDHILVYFLWDIIETESGEELDVWRPLPQQLFTENGLLIYNYDHTIYDTRLFIDSAFNPDLLGAIDTDNWIVRVVIVPADFLGGRTDVPDYEELKSSIDLVPYAGKAKVLERREISN